MRARCIVKMDDSWLFAERGFTSIGWRSAHPHDSNEWRGFDKRLSAGDRRSDGWPKGPCYVGATGMVGGYALRYALEPVPP